MMGLDESRGVSNTRSMMTDNQFSGFHLGSSGVEDRVSLPSEMKSDKSWFVNKQKCSRSKQDLGRETVRKDMNSSYSLSRTWYHPNASESDAEGTYWIRASISETRIQNTNQVFVLKPGRSGAQGLQLAYTQRRG